MHIHADAYKHTDTDIQIILISARGYKYTTRISCNTRVLFEKEAMLGRKNPPNP